MDARAQGLESLSDGESVDNCMYKCHLIGAMPLALHGFDWDAGNREKCVSHGVSIAEIETLFASAVRVAPDIKHADVEARYIAIGLGDANRPIFVAFTFRNFGTTRKIRPISARFMHDKELARYASKRP